MSILDLTLFPDDQKHKNLYKLVKSFPENCRDLSRDLDLFPPIRVNRSNIELYDSQIKLSSAGISGPLVRNWYDTFLIIVTILINNGFASLMMNLAPKR